MLNKSELKVNWYRIKTKLKEKFPQLGENDLMYAEGKEDQLMEKIQQKTGKPRREIEQEIDAIIYSVPR